MNDEGFRWVPFRLDEVENYLRLLSNISHNTDLSLTEREKFQEMEIYVVDTKADQADLLLQFSWLHNKLPDFVQQNRYIITFGF